MAAFRFTRRWQQMQELWRATDDDSVTRLLELLNERDQELEQYSQAAQPKPWLPNFADTVAAQWGWYNIADGVLTAAANWVVPTATALPATSWTVDTPTNPYDFRYVRQYPVGMAKVQQLNAGLVKAGPAYVCFVEVAPDISLRAKGFLYAHGSTNPLQAGTPFVWTATANVQIDLFLTYRAKEDS